jgi:CheY-like chemotaxis protein
MIVESEVGKGTEIQVFLPILKSRVNETPAAGVTRIPGGKERLLLVDDEEVIVRMLKQMLVRLGYQVTVRTGSIEALEAFKANPAKFDLVISDLTMPNMTGIQLAQEIKSIREDIPIVLCTGFSEQIDDEKAAAMGLNGVLMKPVARSDMATRVRMLLDGDGVGDGES